MSYWVYYGHVNSDNHDDYPTHKLVRCDNEKSVIKLRKQFDECTHKECDNVCFTVLEGREIQMLPMKVVTEYRLGE